MEAEDMVQETYLRVYNAQNVQNPKAFYCKVITNLCLDYLKSAQATREQYFGEWLPEPLLTLPDEVQEQTLSSAFVLLMQQLSPQERAVFLLHEVFDYDYREIAEWLDKEETTCRQWLHRAKAHIQANKPRFSTDEQAHNAIFSEFLRVLGTGDMDGMLKLLSADVKAIGDGGGKASAALNPLHGREVVAKFLLGLTKRAKSTFRIEVKPLNTRMAMVVYDGDTAVTVWQIECDDHEITGFKAIRNPDKLGNV
jgi:RNA polymerase sigma-70 factor, ECF subfamily